MIIIPETNSQSGLKHHLIFGLVSLVILLAGMGSVYTWQHHNIERLDNQLNNYQATLVKDSKISLDELTALRSLPNIVVDDANSPIDLIAYLSANNTQCYKDYGSGYFKVIAQTNDQFAEMQYGCTAKGGTTPLGATPAHILAKKTGSTWSLISPMNQWLPFSGVDVPSCTMVNDNKVSKLVTPQCWQGPPLSSPSTAAVQRTVVPVTNP